MTKRDRYHKVVKNPMAVHSIASRFSNNRKA